METQPAPRQFTQEEVNAILRRALDRQGGGSAITQDELFETARELGIDAAALQAAIDEQTTVAEYEEARQQYIIHRKQKFFEHLRSYLIINAILMTVDLLLTDGTWFYWPLFGWGIGVAFDAADTFWPKEKDIDRGARRIIEKRARLEAELKRLQRKNQPKHITVEARAGKLVIERGDKRIEIG
jgi:hypothetical protein